jgi:RNA polymerase sigma-70 factor (ECF subfamily)
MNAGQLADAIQQAQRGDPGGFDALVGAYSPRLYGYFYRLTGSAHDAEDLLQEVFVRLVRVIGQYEHGDRFDGWLFRIAANLARDRVRRVRRRQAVQSAGAATEDGGPLEAVADPDGTSPDGVLERSEELDRLQAAIDRLPDPERQVILLRHFSQLSFREIAEIMETPLGTALARGHRGLARLREIMDAHE